MKVLMISKALVAGSYHKKLEELAGLGVQLYIVVPHSWSKQRLEIQAGKGYAIHPLKITFNGKHHFHFYKGLSQVFEEVSPDIVHIDEEHYSIVTLQAMRLAKKFRTKAIFFTWQNICKRYRFPFSWIEEYNFINAEAAIAGNAEAGSVLREKGFKKEIAIIPQFGVDPAIFKKMDACGIRDKFKLSSRFVIGYMGRLVREKGLQTLLLAVSRLKADCILVLVGNGPLRQEILEYGRRYGIENRIRIIDHVPSLEVQNYLNCFDCLVLPSLTRPNWKEQFGRVLIEAMACEIPVIGSDSGEIPHVIGDSGFVFHEGDTVELADKLEVLMADQELRESLGNKGRQRVLSLFTQKKVAEDTFNVYKALMMK